MIEATPEAGEPDHDEAAPDRDVSDSAADDRDGLLVVAITVTRTGGFAGLRRTWHARPDRTEAPQWIALIDQCPWDAADPHRPDPPPGADRFMWHVNARCGDAAHEAALAEPEVQGPWRHLIDAVRAATPPDAARGRRQPR